MGLFSENFGSEFTKQPRLKAIWWEMAYSLCFGHV